MSWLNLILTALLICGGASAVTFDESWYEMRANANLKIRNFRAATEALEKVVAINPKNRRAARELGLVYEQQGMTDRAVAQFDRYLGLFPDDAEIAFKQANYLGWSRYQYRRKDAIRYYQLGLRTKEDDSARRRLAKLLASDRATLDSAIEQYELLVAKSPKDLGLRKEFLAVLLWDSRHRPKAIGEAEKLVAEYPSDPSLRHQLAKSISQDPQRNRESIRLYANLVAESPRDRAMRSEYARALAQDPSQSAEAARQYQILLKEKSDFPTELGYAELLARDARTVDSAVPRFEKLVASQPANLRLRLRYAEVLGSRESTALAATREFEKVLQREPSNRDAHRGAAMAYAWVGDRDRAYYHSSLAGESLAPTVKQDLNVGHEPSVGANFALINQTGNQFGLEGYVGAIRSKADVGAFVSLRGELGPEMYATKSETSTSPYFGVGAQYRPTSRYRFDGDLSYHPLKLNGGESFLYGLSAASVTPDVGVTVGFKKEMRTDSLLSTIGEQNRNQKFGAARSNLFYTNVRVPIGGSEISVSPAIGWVSTVDGDSNGLYQVEARADVPLWRAGAFTAFGAYRTFLAHYDRDASGTSFSLREPFGGGYYSPQLFWSNAPKLGAKVKTNRQSFRVEAGPSLQYARELVSSQLRVGVEAGLDYALHVGRLQWDVAAAYVDVADAFHQLRGNTSLTYLF